METYFTMIDVVIPFRFSPLTHNHELRYALRSIEKYLTGVRNVVLVGDRPSWVKGVQHIPHEETNHWEYLTRNIHDKLSKACLNPYVSDKFLYVNDDHFLLSTFHASHFPLHHKGPHWPGRGKYIQTMDQTKAYFAYLKTPLNNYDTHAPMVIDKGVYIPVMSNLNWKKWFGYCVKTSYAYFANTGLPGGTYYPDLKIDMPAERPTIEGLIKDRLYFSVGDKAMHDPMLEVLETLYPNKSKYE